MTSRYSGAEVADWVESQFRCHLGEVPDWAESQVRGYPWTSSGLQINSFLQTLWYSFKLRINSLQKSTKW